MLGQVIFSLLLLVPVLYWIMINSSKPSTPEINEVSIAEKKICVIPTNEKRDFQCGEEAIIDD